jgi:hypothetical protein
MQCECHGSCRKVQVDKNKKIRLAAAKKVGILHIQNELL